jgi:hypothetical protein
MIPIQRSVKDCEKMALQLLDYGTPYHNWTQREESTSKH